MQSAIMETWGDRMKMAANSGGEGVTITATELKENLGGYLNYVREHADPVVITKNGSRIARLTPYVTNVEQYFIAVDNSLDSQCRGKIVSYREFMEIRDKTNLRMEFIDGEIHLMAAPSLGHQLLLGRLYETFSAHLRHCRIVLAPFEMHFHKRDSKEPDVIQPDLAVVCNFETTVTDQGRYTGTPCLVAEILSGGTRKKDLIDKLNTYMLSGVDEYWIIDHRQQNVLIYSFQDCMIDKYNVFGTGSIAQSAVFDSLAVNVSSLFASLL